MKKYLLLLYIFSLLIGQESKNNVALSPVVTYWKTLSIEEKETFLFSYLVQVYETHTELKKDVGYGGITEWYYDNRAELIYGLNPSRYFSHSSPDNDDLKSASELADELTKLKI